MSRQGDAEERALFVRALAELLDTDVDRGLAVELGQQIGRSDLPVWVARIARTKGSAFYVRQAYPTLAFGHSGESGRWRTESRGRKARSTPMRSATRERAE